MGPGALSGSRGGPASGIVLSLGLPRIPLLGTSVNKGKKTRGKGCLKPWHFFLADLYLPAHYYYGPFSATRQLSAAQPFSAERREARVVGGAPPAV